MEDASKALIMAGAILIAILLISLGLILLNSSEGIRQQGNDQLSALDVEKFNSQFTKYAGNSVKGQQVKELLDYLIAYNASNWDERLYVGIYYSPSNRGPDVTYGTLVHGADLDDETQTRRFYLLMRENDTRKETLNEISKFRKKIISTANYQVVCNYNNVNFNESIVSSVSIYGDLSEPF